MAEISDGLRPSDSGSSQSPSSLSHQSAGRHTSSTVTTEVLSRGGGQVAAATVQPTIYSSTSTTSQTPLNALISRAMYPANPTQQTIPPVVYTLQTASYSLPSTSPPNSDHSLLILTPISQLMSSAFAAIGPQRSAPQSQNRPMLSSPYPSPHPSSVTTSSRVHPIGGLKRRAWNAPLPVPPADPQPLTAYPAGLSIVSSPLRPRCPARDRLRLWLPVSSRTALDCNGDTVSVSSADIQRIHDVIVYAWAEGTLVTYASGLLVWHSFCDFKAIPETQRAPASNILIQSFLATLVITSVTTRHFTPHKHLKTAHTPIFTF